MNQIIIALDSTQIKEFLTCEHKWEYAYNESIRRWNSKTKAVDKGSFVHKLLEIFYVQRALLPNKDRFEIALNIIKLVKEGKLGTINGLTDEEIKFILERFNQYVMRWTAYDFTPKIIKGVPGVELGFSKIIYTGEEKHKSELVRLICILEGKIDLISPLASNEPSLCFVDNKTQERYSVLYGHKPQFRTYALATGYNYGVVNYFKLDKTYKELETFRRDTFYYSSEEIWDWKDYLIEQVFKRIFRVMAENNLFNVSDLKPEMLKQTLSSCGGMWETNKCYFTDICETPCGLREHLKSNWYFKVPKWTPWELNETAE